MTSLWVHWSCLAGAGVTSMTVVTQGGQSSKPGCQRGVQVYILCLSFCTNTTCAVVTWRECFSWPCGRVHPTPPSHPWRVRSRARTRTSGPLLCLAGTSLGLAFLSPAQSSNHQIYQYTLVVSKWPSWTSSTDTCVLNDLWSIFVTECLRISLRSFTGDINDVDSQITSQWCGIFQIIPQLHKFHHISII